MTSETGATLTRRSAVKAGVLLAAASPLGISSQLNPYRPAQTP